MQKLFLTKQIRAIENQIMQHMSEWALMQKAADAVYRFVLQIHPNPSKFVCIIGGGNNGGDALTVAALLKAEGKTVEIRMVAPRDKLTGSATKAAEKAESTGLKLQSLDIKEMLEPNAVLIDGLLGIGLSTLCREPVLSSILWVNRQPCPKISVDLPSGLNADTGCAMGAAVQADFTVTLLGAKFGLYTADGPDHAGKVHLASLNSEKISEKYPAIASTLPFTDYGFLARKQNVHKGYYGHVLILGGNEGMAGAVAMAALAALRTGAGLVSAVVRRVNMAAILPVIPESMVYGIDVPEIPESLLKRATVLVIGPGIGEDDWARQCFEQVIKVNKSKVIDASALRLLAKSTNRPHKNFVLTPHPGEAGMLLGLPAADIQSDRLKCAQKIQTKYGGICVLKGAGTIITDGDDIHVCSHGNPGMATAGMGDVLSGIIAALLAQGVNINLAAQHGVLLHALAGDKAAKRYGEVSMISRDVIEMLPSCINR